jgi:chromosomal replication initiation ATPase DnaA
MDKQEYNKIWLNVLEVLKISVSSASYSTYLQHTHLSDLKEVGDRVIAEIGCESFFIKQQVEQRYFGLIQDTISKNLDKNADVSFIVKSSHQNQKQDQEKPSPLFDTPIKANQEEINEAIKKIKFKITFYF